MFISISLQIGDKGMHQCSFARKMDLNGQFVNRRATLSQMRDQTVSIQIEYFRTQYTPKDVFGTFLGHWQHSEYPSSTYKYFWGNRFFDPKSLLSQPGTPALKEKF